MTFEEARAAFPVLARVAYLNAGTFGPLSRPTLGAMRRYEGEELAGGRGGPPYYERMRELRSGARAAVAGVLGVEPESLALTYSTSFACNLVLAGLDLGPGDEIVTTDCEHFGLLGALGASPATVRVARIRDLSAARAGEAVIAEVGPRTRLLALSHVSWLTGNLLPVAELKAETGLPMLVDGAQSAGAIPVDPRPFDFYTVSGQKWLCGPDATGALYVADPERLRVSLPTFYSLGAYEPDGSFTVCDGARRFDGGAIPQPSLAGLAAAIETAPAWRFDRARETAARCRELLARRYALVTEADQSTLVVFRTGADSAELSARLHDRGVLVRSLPGTDWLRVSVGYWTSDDDLDRLLAALEAG